MTPKYRETKQRKQRWFENGAAGTSCRQLLQRASSGLAPTGFATSPGPGPRTWAWSRHGPRPGVGGGLHPSHFFLDVMGGRSLIDVFVRGCRSLAWSRPLSGLSPRFVLVSENTDDTKQKFLVIIILKHQFLWWKFQLRSWEESQHYIKKQNHSETNYIMYLMKLLEWSSVPVFLATPASSSWIHSSTGP